MSLSTQRKPSWLLDENVRVELYNFLVDSGFNVKLVPKTTDDRLISAFSKKEGRVVITNDAGFRFFSEDEVFAVVWLRIPQDRPDTLVASFQKLISECSEFKSKLIILWPNKWDDFSLPFKEIFTK